MARTSAIPAATPLKSENRCPQVSRLSSGITHPFPPPPGPAIAKLPGSPRWGPALSAARRSRWAQGLTQSEAEHREKQSRSLPALPRTTTSPLLPQQQVGAVSPRLHCSGVSAQQPGRRAATGLEPRRMRVGNTEPPASHFSKPRSSVSSRGSSSGGEQRSAPSLRNPQPL